MWERREFAKPPTEAVSQDRDTWQRASEAGSEYTGTHGALQGRRKAEQGGGRGVDLEECPGRDHAGCVQMKTAKRTHSNVLKC